MAFLRKFFHVPIISWVSSRPKISAVPVSQVNLERISVIPNFPEENLVGESQCSTQVEEFTIEGDFHHTPNENERSLYADAVFGDISAFFRHSRDENEQLSLPVVSPDVENGIVIEAEAENFPDNYPEDEEEGSREITQVLETENQDTREITQVLETENQDTREITQVLETEDNDLLKTTQMSENAVVNDLESGKILIRELLVSKGMRFSNGDMINKPSMNIHIHFDMMYVFGTCAFRTFTPSVSDGHRNKAFLGLHMVLFLTIVSLSIIQSFCDAKYFLIMFLAGSGLNLLIRFAYDLTNLVSCAYGAYLLCQKREIINQMVNKMTTYEHNWDGKCANPAFSFVLAIVTVGLALTKALLVVNLEEISVENIVLQSSYSFSEDLFIWSSVDVNTTSLQLYIEFGQDLNSITYFMGIGKIFRDFAFTMFEGMIWDIFGNIILVLLSWMMFFMAFVNAVVENEPDENAEQAKRLQMMRVVVWKMYTEIRVVMAAVNDVFGPLLMLFHVKNVLRYAFFMEHIIYLDEWSGSMYINILYDIVKSEIIYLTATRIAQQNKVIRKWLRNWALEDGKIYLGHKKMDITVVLDELDEEPLGLGQGEFLIHQRFHFGLLGLVSSLFVMLTNKTGPKN